MKNKKLFGFLGLVLFFGLCMTMLSKGVDASAADNEAKLNVTEVSVIAGGSYRLKVYNLTFGQSVVYRSADPTIALVSKTGKVTGISCGETMITATVVQGGVPVTTLQCVVLIGPAAVSIKLTKADLVLAVGKMKVLKTIIFPLNTVETPAFYSTDLSIAKVSSAGRVRAESEGAVQVYAFLSNGQSAVCYVTVLSVEDYAKYLEGMTLEDILAETGDDVVDEGETGVPGDNSGEATVPVESTDDPLNAGKQTETPAATGEAL